MKWEPIEIEWIEGHESLLNDSEVPLKQVCDVAEEYFMLKAGYQSSPYKIIEALAVLRKDYSEFRLQLVYYGRANTGAFRYSWYLETAWNSALLLASYDFFVSEEIRGNNLGLAKAEILKDIASNNIQDVKELFIEIIKEISIDEVRFNFK